MNCKHMSLDGCMVKAVEKQRCKIKGFARYATITELLY